MKEMSLEAILKLARSRLLEFRLKNQDGVSIHIISMEIALCLMEFSVNTNPHRSISKEEQQWFNAGKYIDLIVEHSEWKDLSDLYYKIVHEAKGRNFFR